MLLIEGGHGDTPCMVSTPLRTIEMGCGHEVYIAVLDHIVLPAIADFAPDMIVVVNGLDANAVDPLARMSCTAAVSRP